MKRVSVTLTEREVDLILSLLDDEKERTRYSDPYSTRERALSAQDKLNRAQLLALNPPNLRPVSG